MLGATAALFSAQRTLAAPRTNRPQASAPQQTALVSIVGSLRNDYHSWWAKGGASFAKSVGLPHHVIEREGNFKQNCLPSMATLISQESSNVVFNIDAPPTPEEIHELVSLCTSKKVFFVTQNNLPNAGLRPWHLSPYYVAHIDFDHQLAGRRVAKRLFAAMGGRGGLLALSGAPDDVFAGKRVAGFRAALAQSTGCYMLAPPVSAEGEASAAYDLVRSLVAQYGRRVDGVWAASDDMALGATEALRLYKRDVPVVGIYGIKQAISAVQDGTMTATIAWDAFWQGGVGLSLALHAKLKLIIPATQSPPHRAFYGPFDLVDADNVLEFVKYRDAESPYVDWDNLWGRSMGAIPDE